MAQPQYLTGFGSFFSTEAVPGALPQGQNSPQKLAHGLYAEQLSGSSFTMRRSENLRSWLYRLLPSVVQAPFSPYPHKYWTSQIANLGQTPPDPLRWKPIVVNGKVDFIDGLRTMVANEGAEGCAVHHYCFTESMTDRFFYNADAEMMILPQEGQLRVCTEMGTLLVSPLEIVVLPRGLKFQIQGCGNSGSDLDGRTLGGNSGSDFKGYVGENTGAPLRLPDLGPIGSNGLANPRDFEYPAADYDKNLGEKSKLQMICKFQNRLWASSVDHTPFNVVAWHGNYAPYKYDLRKFNTIGTISYDHPDPSIFTVLTSPTAVPGRANLDFVIFPPRWLVAEHSFRPPYYHRNVMNEYMGLIQGAYDAKKDGFVPGGSSLHNCMTPHGPDADTFLKELSREDKPIKVDQTMAFMFESSQVFQVSEFALKQAPMDKDYWRCWQGLRKGEIK